MLSAKFAHRYRENAAAVNSTIVTIVIDLRISNNEALVARESKRISSANRLGIDENSAYLSVEGLDGGSLHTIHLPNKSMFLIINEIAARSLALRSLTVH